MIYFCCKQRKVWFNVNMLMWKSKRKTVWTRCINSYSIFINLVYGSWKNHCTFVFPLTNTLSPSTNVILLSLYKLQTQVKLFEDNIQTLKPERLGLACIFMFPKGKHENTSLTNYSSATTNPCLDILLIETTLEEIQIPNLKKMLLPYSLLALECLLKLGNSWALKTRFLMSTFAT